MTGFAEEQQQHLHPQLVGTAFQNRMPRTLSAGQPLQVLHAGIHHALQLQLAQQAAVHDVVADAVPQRVVRRRQQAGAADSTMLLEDACSQALHLIHAYLWVSATSGRHTLQAAHYRCVPEDEEHKVVQL